MSIVITKKGQSLRSELAFNDIHSGSVKRVFVRRYNKAVRRDARNIIQEHLEQEAVSLRGLEKDTLSPRERQLCRLQDEELRGGDDFWGWFEMDEHEREMRRYQERQQEQLEDLLAWENRHIHGIS
jgi:hypothetical protein